jgi:hypothetical protein
MDSSSGLSNFAKKLTGYDDGWGVPTTGLVIFVVVLLVATVMLIVNGIYFIKVYDGSTDEDLNNYWSRGGALTLAIVNIVISALLFIEFIIILSVLLKKNKLDDPTCLKAIGGNVDKNTGLPTKNLEKVLKEANLAFTTGNPNKTGYIEGVPGSGPLQSGSLYIDRTYLSPENNLNEGTFRGRTAPVTGFNNYKMKAEEQKEVDDIFGDDYEKALASYKVNQYEKYNKPIGPNLYINPFPENVKPFNEIFRQRNL